VSFLHRGSSFSPSGTFGLS
jgi:hypothetical protein